MLLFICQSNNKQLHVMPNIQIKLNARTTISLAVQGGDERDIIKAISFWDNDVPKKCGLCGSDNIGLSHRTAQSYDFYECNCRDCGGVFGFGQKKDQTGLFPKNQEGWQKPQRGANRQGAADSYPDGHGAAADDDIPF